MSGKTVFISYRRDSIGRAFAGRIFDCLVGKGYDVFLDVNNLGSGLLDSQISNEVVQRSHFISVITPGSLNRCENENDWVRREFEIALSHNRNIVPVCEESIDINDLIQTSPSCMKSLFEHPILTLRHNGFNNDINKLISNYIAPHLAPTTSTQFEPSITSARIKRFKEKFNAKPIVSFIDHVLTLFALIAVLITAWNVVNFGNSEAGFILPIAVILKLWWSVLSLPKEILALANLALLAVAIGVIILFVKLLLKRPVNDIILEIGYANLCYGVGISTPLLIWYNKIRSIIK